MVHMLSLQTSQASATMVALAGLVSSILICNQLGSFNEHCVENLCQAAAIMKGLFGSPGVLPAVGIDLAACLAAAYVVTAQSKHCLHGCPVGVHKLI